MTELQQLFNRHCKYILYLISLYFLGWGFTEYKTIFMGLILGTSVGLYNHWLLMRKTLRLGEAVANGRKTYSLGMFTRLVAVLLTAYIASIYPDIFHFTSVIIGIVTVYAVIMIDFFVQAILKPGNSGKRGE